MAFKIHTDIGLKILKQGIVNGRIVLINYILKNDQIQNSNTKRSSTKSRLLDIVTTRFAKSKIKTDFSKQDTELRIKLGESKTKKILIKYGFIKSKKDNIAQFLTIKTKTNYKSHNDILMAISNKEISENVVIKSCKDEDDLEDLLNKKENLKRSTSDFY